jgi:Raf kinase inhibitor-like YbhB/YbcL family protein
MIITSPSFEDGTEIPKKFGYDNGNINPELLIQNVPLEAKSLALIVHDPDAPRPGGFTHWMVWNINPRTTQIKEESTPPESAEGKNGAGSMGYMGPKPPPGPAHHYHFYLYALDAELDLKEADTAVEILQEAIGQHEIAKAELVGLYKSE